MGDGDGGHEFDGGGGGIDCEDEEEEGGDEEGGVGEVEGCAAGGEWGVERCVACVDEGKRC